MKIAVIGSREFGDYERAKRILSVYPMSLMVSGGAKGADSIGEKYADEHGIQKLIFPAQWDLFGKKAGHMRNMDIIKNADMVVAFWNQKSKGTRDSIGKAYNLKKPTLIIYF